MREKQVEEDGVERKKERGRKGEIENKPEWKRDGEGKKTEKARRHRVWELFYERLREAKYVYELTARRAPGIVVSVASPSARAQTRPGRDSVVRARTLTCQKSISSSEESPFSVGFAVPPGREWPSSPCFRRPRSSNVPPLVEQHRFLSLALALR